MKICIDDGSTNIKLAWTENGEHRNAISPNSFKSEWSAPFGGTQPANYMLDGVRYGFDPVNGMRTSHHIANTIIEHRHDEAWLRQHIHNDAHYASLMAVIREKEETLKQRVIRALAVFSGYGRVMVVGGGAEIVAPAIREACGVNATFIADGVPQFALVNGLYAMDKE